MTVPRVFATLHIPEIIATSISETITATAQVNTQGTPLYFSHMDLHNIRWLHDSAMNEFLIFVLLPDNDTFSRNVESVESYDDCPKKSESGGAGDTYCIYSRYQSTIRNSLYWIYD